MLKVNQMDKLQKGICGGELLFPPVVHFSSSLKSTYEGTHYSHWKRTKGRPMMELDNTVRLEYQHEIDESKRRWVCDLQADTLSRRFVPVPPNTIYPPPSLLPVFFAGLV